jgi:hypothetical protein
MNFIILFFSLVTTPLLQYKFDRVEKNIYSGCDGRYPTYENGTLTSYDDQILLAKISRYFLYKDFLRTLENDKISIKDKLRIIEDNSLLNLDDNAPSKYTINLLAGGLMDDFNWEL